MTTETRKRIRAYKKALPELRERVIAVALLLAMSVSMLASASFAWITLSAAPEVSGMQTTVAANGNLEIALAQGPTTKVENGVTVKANAITPGESQVGDSSAAEDQTIVGANVTWGNLVNVSDPSYGLSQIDLRPALLSTYNRTEYPLNGATYGGDGRVVTTNDRYGFASYSLVDGTTDQYYFAAGDKVNYGVRAISSMGYSNASGNARIDNYRNDTSQLYQDAQSFYAKIVSDEPNDVNTLDAASGVTCISALQGLVTVFAQDKLNSMGLGNGTDTKTSCSPYLWHLYQMMLLLEDALEMEGKAILEMANWQAYAKAGVENTFASIDDLMSKTTSELAEMGVKIGTLADYKDSLNELRNSCIEKLYPMAIKCQNPDVPEQEYYWDNIAEIVNVLVHINSAKLNKIELGKLGAGDVGSILGSSKNKRHPVVVYGGLLVDIEERFVTNDCRVRADVEVTVTAKVSILALPVTVYGTVYTEASEENYAPDYTADMDYSEGLQPGTKGDAAAKDTYGLAIDLWVRSNYPDAVLTLEGSAKYEDKRDTITIEGRTYELYTITVGEDDVQAEVDVYQKDDKWYYASSQSEVTETAIDPKEKYTPVIVGYEGENRVWENWRDLLEGGYIEQDATTQGAGSCFVFYADTPTEQAKIMEMLEAFNVAFIDQSGALLGTAQLNLDSAYANQGKVTVPLEVATGVDYTDDSGASHKGITQLSQNTPVMITAIVYLNGSDLKNENVLAEGELQGQLNIQFGTDSTLIAPDNEELQQQARTITAAVTVNGTTVTNDTIGGAEGLEYRKEGYKATVNLTIDGDQPERISGFFVRVINSTQGTRGEEKSFTRNEDGTWTAEFTLTNPGTYVFDTLLVDGVQYTLHDGTGQSGLNQTYEANRPKVHIKGLKIVSASVGVTPGTYMTADSSMEFPVTVKVDAAVPVKQVNAQFFNENDSKQYTAILTYDQVNDQWVGSANISSSDPNYTLKYISVDGTTLDAPATGSYTLYLGLTARVSTTVPAANHKYVYTGDPVQLPMRVYIYDDSHSLIPDLTEMKLYYNNMLSPASMSWTGSYYEGVLDATNAGTMTFKEIVLGNNIGTIRSVSSAPVFEASQVEPVDYVVDSGEVKFGKKVVIGDSTPDEMTVQFVNGQTADVWAVMTNSHVNRTDIIPGVRTDANDQNKVTFYVPTDVDGEWTLTKLLLQDCFDDQGNQYPVTGNAPTEDDSLVFTLTAEEQAEMKSKIFATYNVSVTIGNTVKTYKSNDNKSAETVTVNLTPEAGTFLEGHETGDIVVTVTDYEGNPFSSNIVSADKSALQIQHDKDTTLKYGSYTGASGDKIDFTASVSNSTVTFAGMTLNHAGEYNTGTFNVNIGGSVVPIKVQPKFTISSKSPTVTVTGVSPTSGDWMLYSGTRDASGQVPYNVNIEGVFNTMTEDSALVYIYTQDGSRYEAQLPEVTLELSGMPSSGFTASMTFKNPYSTNDASYDATFGFEPGRMEATEGIGGVIQGSYTFWTGSVTNPKIFPAGKQTVSSINVKYGDQTLTVDLSNPVTINQPQYPPYVDFVIDNSTYLGNKPARVISTTGDNQFTVELPDANEVTTRWTESKTDTVVGQFVEQDNVTTTYYETWNDDCDGAMYQQYDKHVIVSQADETVTSYTRTWTLTGWKVGNTTYAVGETITVTGSQTINAVITYSDSGHQTTENIVTRTVKYFSPGSDTAGAPPSDYTDVSADPDNGNKDRWTQSSPNTVDTRTPKN